MKMTTDTLPHVLRPRYAQLPLPSLTIQLELAARRGSEREPQTLATPPLAPRRSAETLEGLRAAKPQGARRGSSARLEPGEGSPGRAFPPPGLSTPRPLWGTVASASRSQIRESGLHQARKVLGSRSAARRQHLTKNVQAEGGREAGVTKAPFI